MDMADPSPGPETDAGAATGCRRLDDALNALPVAWRECLILREVEALSYVEMARIMGRSDRNSHVAPRGRSGRRSSEKFSLKNRQGLFPKSCIPTGPVDLCAKGVMSA